jgi:hypothetical protein
MCIRSFSQWKTYYTSTNASFNEVKLVDQNIIWACGSGGVVVRTVNAGFSWINSSGNLPNIGFRHISAIDQNNAWVTGGSDGSKIYRTINGGLNWVEQTYTQPKWINKIHFFNSNTGIFIRDPLNPGTDTAGFFITRNGGLNWYKSTNSPLTTIIYENCMEVVDSNFVCIIDNDKIYMLKGGLDNVWEIVQIAPSIFLWNVSFINSNTGYVSGDLTSFEIFKTTNAGLNWNSFATHDYLASLDMDYIPNTNFAFVTAQQEVRVSTNSGINWSYTTQYLPADSVYLSQIDAGDTNTVWLAGNKGRLFKYDVNYIGINSISTEVPSKFVLYQNYPNPFNPVTRIRFDLPNSGNVMFTVYDILGKEIFVLNETKDPGMYELTFNGEKLSSGIYYYKLQFDNNSEVRKMVLLK